MTYNKTTSRIENEPFVDSAHTTYVMKKNVYPAYDGVLQKTLEDWLTLALKNDSDLRKAFKDARNQIPELGHIFGPAKPNGFTHHSEKKIASEGGYERHYW